VGTLLGFRLWTFCQGNVTILYSASEHQKLNAEPSLVHNEYKHF
jgi:hypothetical protein